MGAMKRLLEERIEQVLKYYFPDGMSHMSSEEKVKWYATAHRVAEQLDDGFGYKEAIEEREKK
jgi:hypothetical protein